MQKTKSFTQYSGNLFLITTKIGINGNVVGKSIFYFYGEYDKKRNKIWRENNIEYIKVYHKKYRESNKKHIKEINHLLYIKNKYNKLQLNKKWRKDNPKKMQQCHNKWVKNNLDKMVLLRQSRRRWGTPIPLNKYFSGSHLHHTHRNEDHKEAIFIPKKLHNSVWHSHKDQKTMNKINKLAFEWLGKQT